MTTYQKASFMYDASKYTLEEINEKIKEINGVAIQE